MLKLHYLNQSRAIRVLWLLEELGLEYELVTYKRTKAMLAPKSLKENTQTGKSPVLEDGDLELPESGAIIEYLLATYDTEGKFALEPGSKPWVQSKFWLHFAEASLMPPLVVKLVFQAAKKQSPGPVKLITGAIAKQVDKQFVGPSLDQNAAMIEHALSQHDYIAGDKLSAADFQLMYSAQAMAFRSGRDLPHLKRWIQRIEARPAFRRAVAKGGPVELPG